MGQIRKGGTRVGLGVGVLEHQRWTGFSRRSLLGYLHNYRLGIFQNQEDWCIWLGLFTLQFVWQFGPGLWCGVVRKNVRPSDNNAAASELLAYECKGGPSGH
ncbi:hypothetical protein BDDG_13142 [Blastomyces dermatitidis ATCC 18188]|uniref:Uncharacterized protein n=1 Tax=Ajellomyces dermatitidis (strain ATCC 18188 / CBS 674.68) TaxID=653446 RepID=A0A0J9ES73_AJEDA|nr:hypothetical protein BDDG_13142 [Blastomyces dermatitidis ATCC 18188]